MRASDLPAEVAPPAHFWMPEYDETSGWEAIDFARSIGYDLDAAQQLALQTMFAEKIVDGRFEPAVFEWAMVCTRQQLKTYLLEAANLADVFVFNHEVMWTAHRVTTTNKTIDRFHQIIESNPDLERRVQKVSRENGDEWIRTRDGGVIEFLARTDAGGRGFSGNKLTLDEALYLTPGMVGSLFPTLTARDEAQVRYASSAGKETSHILRSIRDRGRKGDDPGLCYMEWGDVEPPTCRLGDACTHAKETPGCCVDDETRWLRANPAIVAGRQRLSRIAAFRRSSMPVAEFVREHMGWWEEPAGEAIISAEVWSNLADLASRVTTPPAFGLDVAPNRSWACLVAAGLNQDRRAHVEITSRAQEDGPRLLDYRPGTMWLLDRLEQLKSHWIDMRLQVAAGSQVEPMLPAIERLGIPVDSVTERDVAAACGLLETYAAGRRLVHVGQKELAASIENTRWRDVGDKTRIFSRRKSAGDITPSYAAALALRAVDLGETADYPLDSSVY